MIIPWNFKYSKIAELSKENQQKFIKAHPKKFKKYLTILRNNVILIIETALITMKESYERQKEDSIKIAKRECAD